MPLRGVTPLYPQAKYRGVIPHVNRAMRLQSCPVSDYQTLNLRCDISSADESIRGQVRDEDGRAVSFRGWTEFAAALMSMVEVTKTNKESDSHRGDIS